MIGNGHIHTHILTCYHTHTHTHTTVYTLLHKLRLLGIYDDGQ